MLCVAPQVGAVMNVTLVSVTPAPTGWDGDTDNKLKNGNIIENYVFFIIIICIQLNLFLFQF